MKHHETSIFETFLYILVGGLEHFLLFHLGNVIIPTDELQHFSEGLKPPTR
jgi:hypothetical protein